MIKNLPPYATKYKYIVARYIDGDFWFWGAYADRNRAYDVALEINGVVVTNE